MASSSLGNPLVTNALLVNLLPCGAPSLLHASEQDTSICRPGTTVVDCPAPAFCDLGRILSCDVPFEKSKDGTACVLSAAVKKEADTLVTALR